VYCRSCLHDQRVVVAALLAGSQPLTCIRCVDWRATGLSATGHGYARMLCLEDCARKHWDPASRADAAPHPAESDDGNPCISSCCFGCTHALDSINGVRFHNRCALSGPPS
jgi:hypothetical protein